MTNQNMPLSQEDRQALQQMRRDLRQKTLEELKQLVADAGLSVDEGREERKPAHIRALVQAERRKRDEAEN